MKLIVNGNFARWLRITMFLGGVGIATGGLALELLPSAIRASAFLVGFALMALGGLSSNSHMLGIRPFDDSYRRARSSYMVTGSSRGKNEG